MPQLWPHKVGGHGRVSPARGRAARAEPCVPPGRGRSSLQSCILPEGPGTPCLLQLALQRVTPEILLSPIVSRWGDATRMMSPPRPGSRRWGTAPPARGSGPERPRVPVGRAGGREGLPPPPGGAAPRSAVPALGPGGPDVQLRTLSPFAPPARRTGSTARVLGGLARYLTGR